MPDVAPGHNERNVESRQRLAAVLGMLADGDTDLAIDDDWTVGSLLAHLAFWDGLLAGRWEHALRAGDRMPLGVDERLIDPINAAAMPVWRSVDPERLADVAMGAAEAVDGLIAELPPQSVRAVVASGRPRLLDRSLHRAEHLSAIESRLGR
jgi:DinB family protein